MSYLVRVLGRYDAFSTESEVDEDVGKWWSAECRVRFGYRRYDTSRSNLKSMKIFQFGYRHYDASRPNLKLMTILASGSQPNTVFGLGTGITMLLD